MPNSDTRLCFVIMPFSKTKSCTEEEWTAIFESLIKPGVEHANLNYRCVRSAATRGSLVRHILESLQSAHVVIADLTDMNPNVFYELGVRHALTSRTILLSQNRNDIPFDLRAYANHVYDWRSEPGRGQFEIKLRELLEEIDENPLRPDNPVSDFLQASPQQAPEADDWWNEQGAPEFKLHLSSTKFVEGSLQINMQFNQVSGEEPGGLRARYFGAGIQMDWVQPMRGNVPRKFQMKPVTAMARVPAEDSRVATGEVGFELRFRWNGIDRTIGWIWALLDQSHQGWHLPPDANNQGPTFYTP